ncbi:Small nuclear ribonucleoprotein-associated protein B [Nakaseomyces bracarensis]|uniref:Sm protein B n=1 Tax=Nakaseomyces bracarensis TaxID=273131 RepID=A0ABR4NSK4_9SACH
MSVQVKHNSRLADLINYKLRVVAQDGRVYVGELLAFDKHMNVVLGDCVEECVLRRELDAARKSVTSVDKADLKVKKRVLGLVILRGEQILTTLIEDRPQQTKKERLVAEAKEKKQLKKQKNQRKKGTTEGKISKPSEATRYNGKAPRAMGTTRPSQPVKKFQPPPGFKRK